MVTEIHFSFPSPQRPQLRSTSRPLLKLPDYVTFRTGAVNTHDYIILLYSKPTMPPKKAPVQPKSGPKITGKQSAKHSVKDLRKQASAIKKRECPATSKMNRKELISYIEKHR